MAGRFPVSSLHPGAAWLLQLLLPLPAFAVAALLVGEGRAALPVSVTGKVFIFHVGLFRICAFGCDKRPHVTGGNVSSSSGLKPFVQTAAGGLCVLPAQALHLLRPRCLQHC